MQDKTQYTGCGRMKKVMVLKTSEEVKQARIRERQRQRYLAAQQTMLQAVEQAVVLPEPLPKPVACEQESAEETTSSHEMVDTTTKKNLLGDSLRGWMKGARDSATAIFNNMYTMMMEGD